MKQVLVIDGSKLEDVIGSPRPSRPIVLQLPKRKKKTVRYLLLVFKSKYYLLGFGFTTYNRKLITKNSIYILFKFLIYNLKGSKTKLPTIRHIKYTVNDGCLDDINIINTIKEKHEIEHTRNESMFEFEDELINEFLDAYYNR